RSEERTEGAALLPVVTGTGASEAGEDQSASNSGTEGGGDGCGTGSTGLLLLLGLLLENILRGLQVGHRIAGCPVQPHLVVELHGGYSPRSTRITVMIATRDALSDLDAVPAVMGVDGLEA